MSSSPRKDGRQHDHGYQAYGHIPASPAGVYGRYNPPVRGSGEGDRGDSVQGGRGSRAPVEVRLAEAKAQVSELLIQCEALLAERDRLMV